MADRGEACVLAVFVLPAFEGDGLGRSLMGKAQAYLFQRYQTIGLETAEASRASGFYRHLDRQAVRHLPDGDIRF